MMGGGRGDEAIVNSNAQVSDLVEVVPSSLYNHYSL